jgi:hypothetical protein
MRRGAVIASASAVVLGMVGLLSTSATSQAAERTNPRANVLTFDVVFSPFTLIAANNERDPDSPIALGDEIVFHDQLLANGKQVGDSLGSCVVVSVSPGILANCTAVFRVPGGNITAQFPNEPGPAPKDLAVTGGTGTYRDAGGDGTLVEFGNGRGTLTLRVLSLVARGGRG